MKLTFLICLTTLTCGLFISCGNQASRTSSLDHSRSNKSGSGAEKSLERKIMTLVNQERAKRGLKAVSFHGGLSTQSRGHSDFMKRNKEKFKLRKGRGITTATHFASSNRSKLAQMKFGVGPLTENVHVARYYSGDGAHTIVQDWMNSSVHRNALLGKGFAYCGVGCRKDDGIIYSTLVMALPKRIGNVGSFRGPGSW